MKQESEVIFLAGSVIRTTEIHRSLSTQPPVEQLICKSAVVPQLSLRGSGNWRMGLGFGGSRIQSKIPRSGGRKVQQTGTEICSVRFAAEINVNTLTWVGDNDKEPHDKMTRLWGEL